MSVCCIGGVCIPYTAFFPLLLLILKWMAQKLSFLLPESLQQRLLKKQNDETDHEKEEDGCCCNDNKTVISKQLSSKTAATTTTSSESSSLSNDDDDDDDDDEGGGGAVTTISSQQEWKELLLNDSSYYIVCKFTATWCVPCQQIAPTFAELAAACSSSSSKKTKFVQVDVDDCDEIAAQYRVAMMPTFIILSQQSTEVVGTYRGSNPEQLRKFIHQHVNVVDK
jgi:thioredoxin 1